MLKLCAMLGFAAMLAVPTAALAGNYNFVIDPAKSSITLTQFAGSGSSPLSGTYSLNLGDPSGLYNTRNWNVSAALDTISTVNTQGISMTVVGPGPTFYALGVAAGGFGLTDWNQNKLAIPSTTLANGPNISDGAISTDAHKNISYTINGAPQPADTAWVTMDAPGWSIQVSDYDHLAVAGTGDVESHIHAQVLGGLSILYTVDLWGRGQVPEPGTLGLLGAAGLALLRRRRPA